MTSFYRNVPILATSQAMMMISNSLIITTSALVGFALATDKSLATLPLAIQFISTMLTSIPASYLMKKIGRKYGFLFAVTFGLAGGSLATAAIINNEFWLFVIATAFIGMFNGFGNYYRFAAADAVEHDMKSKAISFVMAGGLIAAFVGPNLANISRNWINDAQFAGSYASLIIVYIAAFIALSFLKLPSSDHSDTKVTSAPARPMAIIARQPKFIVALICGMFGYGVMSLVMTATPLAMDHHAHPFSDTSFVIQWHVVGMFAPSFFTGFLIKRFGLYNILLSGALFGFACVAINLFGTSISHFWTALVLLGLSWNFLFIGATTLLTEVYTPSERAKTQAINEFAVFTTVALASLSAGTLQHLYGWETVNIGVIPLLALILVSILWLKFKKPETKSEFEEMEQPNEL